MVFYMEEHTGMSFFQKSESTFPLRKGHFQLVCKSVGFPDLPTLPRTKDPYRSSLRWPHSTSWCNPKTSRFETICPQTSGQYLRCSHVLLSGEEGRRLPWVPYVPSLGSQKKKSISRSGKSQKPPHHMTAGKNVVLNSEENLTQDVLRNGGSSLAPYYEGILDTPSSLAPFQALAYHSKFALRNSFPSVLPGARLFCAVSIWGFEPGVNWVFHEFFGESDLRKQGSPQRASFF